jgi:hypothetical protein
MEKALAFSFFSVLEPLKYYKIFIALRFSNILTANNNMIFLMWLSLALCIFFALVVVVAKALLLDP